MLRDSKNNHRQSREIKTQSRDIHPQNRLPSPHSGSVFCRYPSQHWLTLGSKQSKQASMPSYPYYSNSVEVLPSCTHSARRHHKEASRTSPRVLLFAFFSLQFFLSYFRFTFLVLLAKFLFELRSNVRKTRRRRERKKNKRKRKRDEKRKR